MSQTDHSFLAGQGLLPFDSDLSSKVAQHEKDLQRKVIKYEKEFNINVSRLSQKEKHMKNSMLAYNERMNSIRTRRSDLYLNQNDLQVRAKRIPKKKTLPKLEQSEIDVVKDANGAGKPVVTPRRYSLKPITSSRTPPTDGLRLNLVDASDLCELLQRTRIHKAKNGPQESEVTSDSKEPPEKDRQKGDETDGVCIRDIKVEIKQKSGAGNENNKVVSSVVPPEKLSNQRTVKKTKSGINFRSEETLKLVQNALQKLQEIEIKRRNTRSILDIPRNHRTKRLQFPDTGLSAIPEDGVEELPESSDKDEYHSKITHLKPGPSLRNSPRASHFSPGLSDIPETDNGFTRSKRSDTLSAFKSLPPIPVAQEKSKTEKYMKERRKRLRNHSE